MSAGQEKAQERVKEIARIAKEGEYWKTESAASRSQVSRKEVVLKGVQAEEAKWKRDAQKFKVLSFSLDASLPLCLPCTLFALYSVCPVLCLPSLFALSVCPGLTEKL